MSSDGGPKQEPTTPKPKHTPGDGIRSMKTSGVFRALNFELYARPNKVTMALGIASFTICIGYFAYMNYKIDRTKYYTATLEDGSEVLQPRTNKWDD